jgi:peptidoglycan/LPS O-acetylase OafA/YrhL
LVIFYHLASYCPHAIRTIESPVIRFGWTGVDLFFVLSGILIGGQLWKELKLEGTVNVRRFILRRGLRIWPIYFTLVAFLFGQEVFFGQDRKGLWLDATFTSNYFHFFRTRHQVSGGWSLSLEEQFYLLAPALLMIGAKFVSPKSLLGLVVAWFLALPVVRHFALVGLSGTEQIHTAIYYPFQTHSDGLALGLLISWIMTWKPTLLGIGRWLDAVLLAIAVVGFAMWYIASPTYLFSVVAISYGVLAFLLLRLRQSLFHSRVFYVISRLSYGVYLFHTGLFNYVMPYHTHWFGEGFRSLFFALILWGSVCLLLTFVTFSLIELPFLELRARLFAKDRTARISSTGALGTPSPRAS